MSATGNDRPAAAMIFNERIRQQNQEGYTAAHDDKHSAGELARFAAAYALSSCGAFLDAGEVAHHPSVRSWNFKPKGCTRDGSIKDLIRAGALILAELERRLRKGETE